jgi:hypothetical protein
MFDYEKVLTSLRANGVSFKKISADLHFHPSELNDDLAIYWQPGAEKKW